MLNSVKLVNRCFYFVLFFTKNPTFLIYLFIYLLLLLLLLLLLFNYLIIHFSHSFFRVSHGKYVEFKKDDLVWVHLDKRRFPQGKFIKFKPRVDGTFKVMKWVVENAYKIKLPAHLNISNTFNVVDLGLYYGDDNIYDLSTILF
jgi:hypothetical protein